MNLFEQFKLDMTRRHFFGTGGNLLGAATLGSLLGRTAHASTGGSAAQGPHFPGKAKHVIYLHMVGGPSQMDLFDYKPKMREMYDIDLPESVRQGQRLTTMTSGQNRFPIAPSAFKFRQHGQCGMWVSEVFPNIGSMADDLTFVRSMHTDAINHEPAISLMQTGNQVAGRPCMGAWTSYGLGTMNENLPTFAVMTPRSSLTDNGQAIGARLWSSGFLDGRHSGVSLRTAGDPILFLNNPDGVSPQVRRTTLDGLRDLNQIAYDRLQDPEIRTRIEQYELAYRMQTSVPELADLSQESESTYDLYGQDAKEPGTFANSTLLARRMVERGVRFVQIYHNYWDVHNNAVPRMPVLGREVDRGCYGLVQDLKQRGLLDETLVIWGGEFGRTVYSQGGLSHENYGRDHHPRCFTMWMAGGGFKPGAIYGETDDFSYNIVKDPVHVRDFHATVLHQLGFDHERLTFKHAGLDMKLTGVEPSHVIPELLV